MQVSNNARLSALTIISFLSGALALLFYSGLEIGLTGFLLQNPAWIAVVEESVKATIALSILVSIESRNRLACREYVSIGFFTGFGFGYMESLLIYTPYFWNRLFTINLLHGLWTLLPVLAYALTKNNQTLGARQVTAVALSYSMLLHFLYNKILTVKPEHIFKEVLGGPVFAWNLTGVSVIMLTALAVKALKKNGLGCK